MDTTHRLFFGRKIKVVDSDKKRVVHDAETLQDPTVPPQRRNQGVVRLGLQQEAFRQQLHEVQVFEGRRAFRSLPLVGLKFRKSSNLGNLEAGFFRRPDKT